MKLFTLLIFTLIHFFFNNSFAQNNSAYQNGNSQNNYPIVKQIQYSNQLFKAGFSFIENIGQYGKNVEGYEEMGNIQYGFEGLDMPVLFTSKGLIHLHRKVEAISEKEERRLKKQGLHEEQIERRRKITEKLVTMEWLGTNPDVHIEAEMKTEHYFTYGLHQQKASGFKKITYKNIYPFTDVVYYFSDNLKPGFEYNIILRPGADVNRVKMKFGGDIKKIGLDKNGMLLIHSPINTITETAPISFISENGITAQPVIRSDVSSNFYIAEKTISFNLKEEYDRSKTLIIDPFVSNTNTLTGSTAGKAKDIDFDYEGNIYVVGGEGGMLPCKLAKYNSSGVLQWTFNGSVSTPSWMFGITYGGWVVEKTTGKIYLGQGLAALGSQVIRLNAAGIYDNYISDFDNNFLENWKMIWNCNSGSPQLLIAGGGNNSNINFGICTPPSATIASINLTGLGSFTQDIADVTIDPVNNDMYTIFASGGTPFINNRIYKNAAPYSSASIAWNTLSGYNVLIELDNRPYLTPNVFGNFENSINALAVNSSYLFYWDGRNLKALNKSDGSTAGTPLLLGANTVLMQGGIIADECNNIFIGSINGTIKVFKFNGSVFDDALAPDINITGYPNSSVYDLAYDNARQLLYASGDGFVASFDISTYCSNTIYSLSVIPNCVGLSAQAILNPSPPVGSAVTYYLFSGSTQLATNTTGFFTGLTAGGSYTIKAFINEECGGVQTIRDFVLDNCPVSVSLSFINPSCGAAANGSITATGHDGTTPYTFSMDGINFQSSGIFTNLSAGFYTITIKDATNTTATATATLINASTLQVSATATSATCNSSNGIITASGTGGSSPLSYSIDAINYQASNIFNGLAPNTYTVTVKDANNCTNSFSIVVGNILPPQLTATANPATCNINNGSIAVNVTAGTSPYQYSLDGVNFQASNIFTGLAVNNFIITVKDAANCIRTVTTSVTGISPPQLSANSTSTNCNNNTGSIIANASGGTAPYLFSIDGISYQSSGSFNGLTTNNYLVGIKDATGCITTVPVNVGLLSNLTLTIANSNSICEGDGTTLNAVSNGASFSWSPSTGLDNPGALNPIASPATTTTYTLSASLGICTKNLSTIITVNPVPVAYAGKDSSICFGKDLQLTGMGGLQFKWMPNTGLDNPVIHNPILTRPNPGTYAYRLSVVDAIGCKSLIDDEVIITVTQPPKLFIGNDTAIIINKQFQLKAIDVNAAGFVDYLWSPGYGLNNTLIANPIAVLDRDFSYTVIAKTASGCEGTDDIRIKVYKGPDIYVPSAFTPNGDGNNDVLKALPIGMKSFKYFRIFNRYGQLVFTTTNANIGWDGNFQNNKQAIGTYTWLIEAVDVNGKNIIKKGFTILIR